MTDAVEYVEISGYDAEIPEAEISDEYMPDAEAEKAPKAEEKTPRTRTSILRMSTLRTSDKRPSPYNRASATPSETPTTASEAPAGPNNAPAGPKKNTTDLDAIRRKDPQKFMLYWYRKVIQDRINKVRTQGLMSLEHSDIDVLGRVLKELAYCSFGADPSGLLKETKLRVAVRKLINTAEYGDDISGMAKKLLDRWNLGDFEPGPISNDDIGLLEDDDGDDDGEATSIKVPKALLDLLKGIIRFKSPGGRLTMKLDPNYPKRDCNIFGHNGLNVGEYVAYTVHVTEMRANGDLVGGLTSCVPFGMEPMGHVKAALPAAWTGAVIRLSSRPNRSTMTWTTARCCFTRARTATLQQRRTAEPK